MNIHAVDTEFMAIEQTADHVSNLRYTLRIFGIIVHDPAYNCEDNQSVLANSSMLESMLKEKSHSVAFHSYCEGCVIDEYRIN